jgi:hypothetical protein
MKCKKHKGRTNMVIVEFPADDCPWCKLEQVKEQLSLYIKSEGCSCCEDTDAHELAKDSLGELLDFPAFADGSGYNFYNKETK